MTDLFQQNNTLQYFQDRGNEERQNQIDIINNFVSPEFIQNETQKGKISAFETLKTAKKWGYAVPYIGTGVETAQNLKILNLQNKVREGVQLSSEEIDTYKEFVLDIASQAARGQTVPSMAFDGFLQSIPYMAEFGIGLAYSGIGVGLASLGQTGGKIAVKKALKDLGVNAIKDTTKQAVKKQIAMNTAKTLAKDSTLGVAKFNMKYLPQQGVKRFSEVELDENLMITPEGQVLLNEAEQNPATSVMKAMALMQIESFSETTGYMLNLGTKTLGKYISPILLRHLPEKFITNLNKLSKQVTGLSTVKALQKFGWNGILEEFGEERVSDFLQVTFDLDGQEGYSFEQFLQAMFPPRDEAKAELLSFALMGGTGSAIARGADYSRYRRIAKDIQEKSKNDDGTYNTEKMKRLIKRNNPSISSKNLDKAVKSVTDGIMKTKDYSVDDFLLDCGVFRIQARKSNTDERLTKILQEGGVKEEEIENFLDFASLDDKAQLLKIHEEANTPKQDYSALKSELIKAGHSEEQADLEVQSLNRIDEILMDKYNADGEAENLIKKRNLKIQTLQNEIQQQKAYFTKQTNQGVDIDISHDVVRHDSKKHSLSKEEWNDLFASIDENIEDKILANKSYYRGIPVLLKVNVNGDYYGVAMEVFSDRNIITTAFKSTEKGVDTWIEKDKKKSAGTTAPNHQSGSSIVRNNNVISGQTLTDIITDIKGNLNLTRKQESFDSENPNIYYQSAMKKSSSDNFADFYKAVLSKPKNTNDKEQFNAVTKDNLNIRIPHDTVIHDENRHKLTADEWQDLLDNIDNVSYAAISKKKSRFGGTPVLLKVDTENNSFGVVVETFAKNNPLISTAFIDTQSNIENWIENNRIKNETVPNGTKTTFLDISLTNIITNINPKFKSKIINLKTYYQSIQPKVIDWTDKFSKVPTFQEIEKHIKDIIASGEVFDTLSPEWKIDIKGGNRVVDKITNQGNFQRLQNSAKKRHNKYVSGIKELINNSSYSHTDENRKPKEKPNILNFHYFDTNVRIGEKIYQVRLECEENKNVPQGNYAKRSSKSHRNSDSVNQNDNDVKVVHLYNIKEVKATNIAPQEYFQSAYHGTPHRFDEFSLDNIGSGEGFQAHGWGLYFAEDREVSDGYRKFLSGDNDEYSVPVEIKYNGQDITKINDNADLSLALEQAKNNGLEAGITYLKNEIRQINDRINADKSTIEKIKKGEEDYFSLEQYEESIKDKEEYIVTLNELIDFVKSIDLAKLEVEQRNKGQLFEVEIPENDVLLDEDLTFNEQPEKVQDALREILLDEKFSEYFEDFGSAEEFAESEITDWELGYRGGNIYDRLAKLLDSDKEASLLLNEYGVKGITYNGYEDGRCYVIFDDKAIKVLETYYQNQEEPRAKIEFGNNETIISLAQGHDASSFMHELAHMYLHDLQELANTNKRAEKDLREVYEMLNFNEENATPEEFTGMHERFARSFEAYLLNGQAPTARLKSIFERFKEFLKDVYESLSDLNVEFSKEVQECFDRLFTTDEEYENEVLPLYRQNQELADSINSQETLSYKIKNNINAMTDAWKSFYDTVIIPIDTRLGKISPELKKLLRKHTFDLTYQSKKDCDKITPFLLKIKEIKNSKKMIEFNKTQFNAYNLLSYALNNRDSYTVNKVVKTLGIQKEFAAVRELLDQLHEETESIGLSVGYLESYYPRMVRADKTDEFIELFEKMTREEEVDINKQLLELDEAEYSNVKRTIRENDVHGLWNNADKAKLINTAIRGFGKNNIMLSRIGQLKFERLIDKLTPEQQQFYEPIEKALSNYVIGARKNIEERKFFGAENKEVSKLRASIKRKRETLREVKTRTPQQAKWKELNRLKYELAPIEIKIETISGEMKNNIEELNRIKDVERKEKVQGYINNQKELLTGLKERADRLKSQIEWTEQSNNLKVKNVVVKRLNDEIAELNKQIEEILGDIDHVEDSIGRLIIDLAEKNIIHVKDERVVRDLLVSRFNTLRLEKAATAFRDASTIVTLNDITNAITQITDLTFSAFKFGLFNTFQGMRGVEGLNRESLGINNIAEEFRGASSLSAWLNTQLKIIGLDLIDGFAKNTAINASVLAARQQAKKNSEKLNEKLNFLFGEELAQKVKKDLIDGKITDEIIFIAFNDLADIQPISTDQMTRGYQSGFKPLYVLKTYSIKALDILRNECFSKITSGVKDLKTDKAKGMKQISEGLKNLIRLQLFMWLFGLPQDLIKDLIANRDFDIPEHVIDNILIFGIFNRFLVKKVSENPANIYIENIKLPIFQAIGDLWTGIGQVKKGKKEIKDLYVWSRVPIVGKLYYNWLGGRKDKRVKLN